MSRRPQLTTPDLVVLALLRERPMHGYELVKTLEERDSEDWAPISRPQVYYSLRKLAKSGYIVPARDPSPALGPDRVVYKTARKALTAMQKALSDFKWAEQRPPTPFTTWAVLAEHADKDTAVKQVQRRAAFLKKNIKREKETLKSFDQNKYPRAEVGRLLVTLAIKQFQVELGLLDDLRAAIRKTQQ